MTDRIGYADIVAKYRQRIDTGELAPGDAMPSMRAVEREFDVAITTVNRAFRQLKTEGLTVAKPGVGTVVADRTNVAATGVARIDRLQQTGRFYAPDETSSGHVAMLRSCADLEICRDLDIELHDEIVIRRRVFRKEGTPTVVALSCIHPRALGDVPELLQHGQLRPFWQTTYRERTGREIKRSPERRSARLASRDELDALEVIAPSTAAVPVLVLHTAFHDQEGPIEVWEDVYAPGLWQVDTPINAPA